MVEFMARKSQGQEDLGMSIPPTKSKDKQRLVPPTSINMVFEGSTRGGENHGRMENSLGGEILG